MLDPLKNVMVIGDRILIKPLEASNKTGSGLYLPPSVKEHDAVHTGLVVKVGPGYPIPAQKDPDAVFRGESSDAVNYVPLQVKEGDEALYLHANGTELEVNGERYLIISQNAVLLVMRPEMPDDVSGLMSSTDL
ncbi:MAG: co-chaperone GroES family protein [Fibrobacter sp.]|nr:co-chaperone GroES family protein [Fibrobacter sp.]